VLERIPLNIDGDGKMDEIVLVDTGDEFSVRMDVHLTKTGKILRFEKAAARLHSESAGHTDDDGSVCRDVNIRTFEPAPKGGFVWTEVTGTYDGCNSESREELLVQYRNGDLFVQRISTSNQYRSMGDPSPYGSTIYDFNQRRIRSTMGESHAGPEITDEAKIPASCRAVSLAEHKRSGTPKCSYNVFVRLQERMKKRFCRAWRGAECPF